MSDKTIHTYEIKKILNTVTLQTDVSIHSGKLIQKVTEYVSKLRQIFPYTENTDNTWWFWIKSERGDIDLFDDYEDLLESGEVENYDDFIELWEMENPHETEWHKLIAVEYKETFYFYLDSELLFLKMLFQNIATSISRMKTKLLIF